MLWQHNYAGVAGGVLVVCLTIHFKMLKLSVLGIFALFVFLSFAENEETKSVVYSGDSFSLGLADNNFVMFYSPKCPKSQELRPVWEKLSQEYNDGDKNVIIATVDCTKETALCSDHDVLGYPTLKFFKAGHEIGQKYSGTRTLEHLKKFIQEELEKEEGADVPKVPTPLNTLAELTDDTFDDFISVGKHFVKMYAPWCVHCKELAPVWDELAESFQHVSNVQISKVNCELHKTTCKENGVRGYPTLLWFEDGKQITKYSGPRTHEALKSFVVERLNLDADLPEEQTDKPSIENPVVLLSGGNFQSVIAKGVTLVKFYAPWCGFCKRMAPVYNDLATKFLNNPLVKIAKVDCTMDINTELCSQEKIEGFPTILLYKNGDRIIEYNGNRKLEDLYSFVSDNLEAHDEL